MAQDVRKDPESPAPGVVVANADGPHADLFRALRGGGGGTYGAVVEFTVRIHPFPKSYTRHQTAAC